MINYNNNSFFYLAYLSYTLLVLLFLFPANSQELHNKTDNTDYNKTKCEINFDTLDCFNYKIDNDFKVTLLEQPYRILLNFEDYINFTNKSSQNNLISQIRYSQNSKGSRLVLDLSEPAIITDIVYEQKKIEDIIDLKIKITKTTAAKFIIAQHIIKQNRGDLSSLNSNVTLSKQKNHTEIEGISFPKKRPTTLGNNTLKKYIVFIDPGHGGKDPGAIGQLGTLEKDITLRASVMLAKKLRQNQITIPILSRNKDIYLSLGKRTKLAKNYNADIFISIHADSSRNKKAKGLSVFSLSNKASDKEAELLAKRENKEDLILGDKNLTKDPIIYGSLIKMFQRKAMNESSFLARNILLNLEKTKLTVNRGHRFAGFAVLKSYDIPSILVEIGFLSNKKEERKLLKQNYLEELTDGLSNAIEDYFKSVK